jgi:hypothetical protein
MRGEDRFPTKDQVQAMKSFPLTLAITVLSSVAVLAACGGGDDDTAGSPTAFSVVPTTITLSVPAGNPDGIAVGTCGNDLNGNGSRVFVYGGVAPYRLDNTSPDEVVLDRTSVGNRGDYFTAWFTGGCTTSSIVVIRDALDRQVQLTMVNQPATAASAP